MEVHKFGGASLSDATGVRRMGQLVAEHCPHEGTWIVVSAMGKTTNALEKALEVALTHGDLAAAFAPIENLHHTCVTELNLSSEHVAKIDGLLADLQLLLEHLPPTADYDTLYDQVIAHGELLSSLIFAAHLQSLGISTLWVDVRTILRTNSRHRRAIIDPLLSRPLVQTQQTSSNNQLIVTQGFIASDSVGATTTLGREGSDYSAALLGCFLGASSVSIWKDVAGLYNADPKQFADAEAIDEIDYREVIEIAYNGAKVIHEKALKPLQNANIPLRVRSFVNPTSHGTLISNWQEEDARKKNAQLPLVAIQEHQVLLTVSPHDLSFALQDYASQIFEWVCLHGMIVRLVQNSAVRLSLSLDYDSVHFPQLLAVLKQQFQVSYNLDVVLLSIRHIPNSWREELNAFPGYLLTQQTRSTSQYLLLRPEWESQLYPLLSQAFRKPHKK